MTKRRFIRHASYCYVPDGNAPGRLIRFTFDLDADAIQRYIFEGTPLGDGLPWPAAVFRDVADSIAEISEAEQMLADFVRMRERREAT